MKAPKDLKGYRSGQLTVLSPADPDYRGRKTWHCRCDCGASAIVGDAALRHRTTRSCGCLTGRKPIIITPALAAKFWSVIGEDLDPTTCWEWPLSQSRGGYGQLSWRGRPLAAHRVALAIKLGGYLGDDVEACHSCDNPSCVLFTHLHQGSHRSNHQEAAERNRYETSKKATRARVLTQVKADAIRKKRADGVSARALAREYGVDEGTIHRVVSRKIWNKKGASK